MLNFTIKRLLFSLVTLFAVLTLIFIVIRIVPGDPAQVILGDFASVEATEALRERLGLNKSLILQYWEFISNALQGDWGRSLVSGMSVSGELAKVLPYTIELTVVSLLIGAIVGVPLGVLAAVRRNRAADYITRILSLIGLSFPAFVSAVILLLVFAIELRWLPVISAGGEGIADTLRNLALPAFSLGLLMAAYITRVTRSAMLEVLSEDYVRTAMAKGVPATTIVWRHCLRNALIPVVTIIGLYTGVLIGSSVLTEIVFSRPGLGKLIVGALNQRDYTMLQGLMVIYTFIVIIVNLLTDLTYGLIDPRVKYK